MFEYYTIKNYEEVYRILRQKRSFEIIFSQICEICTTKQGHEHVWVNLQFIMLSSLEWPYFRDHNIIDALLSAELSHSIRFSKIFEFIDHSSARGS